MVLAKLGQFVYNIMVGIIFVSPLLVEYINVCFEFPPIVIPSHNFIKINNDVITDERQRNYVFQLQFSTTF